MLRRSTIDENDLGPQVAHHSYFAELRDEVVKNRPGRVVHRNDDGNFWSGRGAAIDDVLGSLELHFHESLSAFFQICCNGGVVRPYLKRLSFFRETKPVDLVRQEGNFNSGTRSQAKRTQSVCRRDNGPRGFFAFRQLSVDPRPVGVGTQSRQPLRLLQVVLRRPLKNSVSHLEQGSACHTVI